MTLKAGVDSILNDLGKTLTLRSVTEGSYNVNTGGVTNTTSDTSVIGMLLNYKDLQRDGDIIQQGDSKIVIKTGTAPDIQDIILDGSVQYRVISVRQIEESGNDVVYICQVRQ